jgi:hypothetical protein
MSKFKEGDNVIISEVTNSYSGKLKLGSLAVIGQFNDNCTFARMIGELNIMCGWHDLNNIKHAEKWTIYNNTKPWSELSDKQKGKLLVADNRGLIFNGFTIKIRPSFSYYNSVYAVTNPDTVKPEPTMAELFDRDWKECFLGDPATFNERMIAKGWTKP